MLAVYNISLTILTIRSSGNAREIHVEGIVPTYSYILLDHLLMDQLWETVINDRHHHLAEVKIVTNNKTFFVHKTILAARSSVFAKQFKQPPKVNANIICIAIKDVCSTTVEDFLHFIYTGESEKMDLTNQELLKLAHQYQLTTLMNLCLAATEKVDVNRTAFSMINLHQNVEQVTTPEIR
jgi:speckle-type POZ protein